jgi:hypothetical protein
MKTEVFIKAIANMPEEQRRALADILEATTRATAPAGQQAPRAAPGYPPRRA